MPDRNTVEGRLVIAENIRHACKKGHFLFVHIAIGSSDMEKPVEDVFQQMTVGLPLTAQSGKLTRIGFVARNILFGEIVEPRDMRRLFLRHREYVLKGTDFILGDNPVRLGHLGGKRDHRDGESHPAARVGIAFKNGAHGFDNASNGIRRHGRDKLTDADPNRHGTFL